VPLDRLGVDARGQYAVKDGARIEGKRARGNDASDVRIKRFLGERAARGRGKGGKENDEPDDCGLAIQSEKDLVPGGVDWGLTLRGRGIRGNKRGDVRVMKES